MPSPDFSGISTNYGPSARVARLPVELAEQIIDTLRDDPASLLALSLVHSSWLPRSRCHLFHTVHIQTAPQLQSLVSLLSSRPHLGALIQSVTISVHLQLSTCPQTLHEVAPIVLLSRLPKLSHWHFRHRIDHRLALEENPGSQPVWKLSFRSSTISCLRQYRLVERLELGPLVFRSCSDFTRALTSFPRLHTLVCTSVDISSPITSSLQASFKGRLCLSHLSVCLSTHKRIVFVDASCLR